MKNFAALLHILRICQLLQANTLSCAPFAAVVIFIMGVTNMPNYSIAAQISGDEAKSLLPSLQKESTLNAMPTLPREMLMRIKHALDEGLFLHESFYSDENLKAFFGEWYTFRYHSTEFGNEFISFDDLGNIYVGPDGNLTLLGKNRPCFQGGTFLFQPRSNAQKANASIALTTSVRINGASSFRVEMVQEIFGSPDSITKGIPTAPPLHGRAYVPEPKTHDLGNSWIKYKEDRDGFVSKIEFRTLGDGEVAEIQIYIGEK